MDLELSAEQLAVIDALRFDRDAFENCSAPGQCGSRLRVLASLRRLGLIDHRNRLTTPLKEWPDAA